LSPGVLGLDSGCTTQQIEEESMIFVGDDWAEDHVRHEASEVEWR
jgi:hypothetical protein